MRPELIQPGLLSRLDRQPRKSELASIIRETAGRIAAGLSGGFRAICLTGAAARDESSFDPEGGLLGDLDFLVVLSDRFFPAAWIAERRARRRLTAGTGGFPDFVSIGFSHTIARYWMVASPMMLEFRTGRVLAGDDRVLDWPAVRQPAQIPAWEGIRLVANRVCELLEELGRDHAGNEGTAEERIRWNLAYQCVKLGTACGDCLAILKGEYRPTYRERLERLEAVVSPLSPSERVLVKSAYRTKLNLTADLFHEEPVGLILSSMALARTTLGAAGLGTASDLRLRAQRENPATPGLLTDWAFALGERVHGRGVAWRRAMGSLYVDAWKIVEAILHQNLPIENTSMEFKRFGSAYRRTPQIARLVESGQRAGVMDE